MYLREFGTLSIASILSQMAVHNKKIFVVGGTQRGHPGGKYWKELESIYTLDTSRLRDTEGPKDSSLLSRVNFRKKKPVLYFS